MSEVRTEQTSSDGKRLLEIIRVLSQHKITQGMTPEKLCSICKELGATFVKIGQILSLRPDMLPKDYCEALATLRTDAEHMITAQIREVISDEYGQSWHKVFENISAYPLGSASVSQVHEGYLLDGTHVAVKVLRPNTYSLMERDIRLLKKALAVLRFTSIGRIFDINEALDEVWETAQEELDLLQEADNIERVSENMREVAYVRCPAVYREYCTKNVLVMEYIGGYELSDLESLRSAGYDTKEICRKLTRNYIKQVVEDRFFHADPHTGNLRILDGQIVWLDMGMMGKISEEQADAIFQVMHGVLINDDEQYTLGALKICGYGEDFPRMEELRAALRGYSDQYRTLNLKKMSSTSGIVTDALDIAVEYGVQIPKSFTMLARSLLIMETLATELDEDTDIAAILGKHLLVQTSGDGFAASVAKKMSHRKLVSGSLMRHGDAVYEEPEEEDEKDVSVPDEEQGNLENSEGESV